MQIKVTDARIHKPQNWEELSEGKNKDYSYSVVEAKLVLIERLPFTGEQKSFQLKNNSSKLPILISETEDLVDRDWLYDSKTGLIEPLDKKGGSTDYINSRKDKWYKILALSEHFSSQQLQMIVDGELKDGDKVMVECEDICLNNIPLVDHTCTHKGYKIKLNSSNHITLHKIEEKMYTKEEVKQYLLKFAESIDLNLVDRRCAKLSDTEKWFEQNVK